MGKRSRTKDTQQQPPARPGEVGPRQPCPCGSGRRYKACHGNPSGPTPVYRARPFEGLPSETDVVAMREFVPAATAPLPLVESDRSVTLCSLLPGASPALVRDDGSIWLGLQVQHSYGDPSRDLAACLTRALAAEPGTVIGLTEDPGEGPRLQDLVVEQDLEITVHQGFDFWLADVEDSPERTAALEQANGAAAPTTRIAPGAYWTRAAEREYLRFVLPFDEAPLLDAFSRLHAAQEDSLVQGDRVLGTFRAHGLLAPVWDLPPGTGPDPVAEPLAVVRERLVASVADTTPLTDQERSARAWLTSRQLTIR